MKSKRSRDVRWGGDSESVREESRPYKNNGIWEEVDTDQLRIILNTEAIYDGYDIELVYSTKFN